MKKFNEVNTGRDYSPKGQIIRLLEEFEGEDDNWYFIDVTRGIYGCVRFPALVGGTWKLFLHAYDRQDYAQLRPGHPKMGEIEDHFRKERGSLHHPSGRSIDYLAMKAGKTCRWYFVDPCLGGTIYGVVTFCNDREGNPKDFLRMYSMGDYIELWPHHFRIARILDNE